MSDKPTNESDADRIAAVRKKVQDWIKTTQQQQEGAPKEQQAQPAAPESAEKPAPKKRALKGKGAAEPAPAPEPEQDDGGASDDESEAPPPPQKSKHRRVQEQPRKQRVRVTPRPDALQELVRRSVADYYDEFVHEKTKKTLEKQGEATSQALSESYKFFAFN